MWKGCLCHLLLKLAWICVLYRFHNNNNHRSQLYYWHIFYLLLVVLFHINEFWCRSVVVCCANWSQSSDPAGCQCILSLLLSSNQGKFCVWFHMLVVTFWFSQVSKLTISTAKSNAGFCCSLSVLTFAVSSVGHSATLDPAFRSMTQMERSWEKFLLEILPR